MKHLSFCEHSKKLFFWGGGGGPGVGFGGSGWM